MSCVLDLFAPIADKVAEIIPAEADESHVADEENEDGHDDADDPVPFGDGERGGVILLDADGGDDVKIQKAGAQIGREGIVAKGLPDVPLNQGDHGPRAAAKGAINMEQVVHNTRGKRAALIVGQAVNDVPQEEGARDESQSGELNGKENSKTSFLLIHEGSFQSF